MVFGTVNILFVPFMLPETVSLNTVLPPLPDIATFAIPAPPLETTAPVVKSIVVTLTTGVIPSVTVNGLPPPPDPPAPVISINGLGKRF